MQQHCKGKIVVAVVFFPFLGECIQNVAQIKSQCLNCTPFFLPLKNKENLQRTRDKSSNRVRQTDSGRIEWRNEMKWITIHVMIVKALHVGIKKQRCPFELWHMCDEHIQINCVPIYRRANAIYIFHLVAFDAFGIEYSIGSVAFSVKHQ